MKTGRKVKLKQSAQEPEATPAPAIFSTPLRVFLINRCGLFLVVYFGLMVIPFRPSSDLWRGFPDNLLLDGWARWDSGWYNHIAYHGYTNQIQSGEKQGQRDTAFFPLYPLIVRNLSAVFGNPFLCGILLSNLAFLAALYYLYRLALLLFGPGAAEKSIILIAFFPFSFFFSAFYPESLYLMAVVAAFYYAHRDQWLVASLFAAAAGAARFPGILLVPALILLYLERADFKLSRIRWNILYLGIGSLGFVGYGIYLGLRFGDYWIWIRPSYAKGWAASFGINELVHELSFIRYPSRILTGQYNLVYVLNIALVFAALVLTVIAYKYVSKSLALWTALNWAAAARGWIGFGRYMAVIFPLFIVLALIMKKPLVYQSYLYISTLLLILFALAFSHYYWVA